MRHITFPRHIWVASLPLVAMAFFYLSCTKDGAKRESEITSRIEAAIQDLCTKHDADTSYIRQLGEIAQNYQVYTIYLQTTLVNSKKPILFRGAAIDVVQRNNSYQVCFITELSLFFSQLNLVLNCTEEQAFTVARNPSDALYYGQEDFAVVATITDVRKSVYEVKHHTETYHDEDRSFEVDELIIDVPNSFSARGTCLELISINELKKQIMEDLRQK